MKRLHACIGKIVCGLLGLNALALGVGAAPSSPEIKLLVSARHGVARVPAVAITASGGRIVADYPAMSAVVVSEGRAAELSDRLAAAGFDVVRLRDEISTPRQVIDPRMATPVTGKYPAGLFIIQYVVPATPAWQAVVRSSGLVVIDSLAERAVIVAGTAEQVAAVANLPWVQYAAPYLPAYKYAPMSEGEHGEYTVVIVDTELAEGLLERIRDQVGEPIVESRYGGQLALRVAADIKTARALLEEPFVLAVETYVPPGPSDERQALAVTGAISPLGGNYLNWLQARGITPNSLTDSGIVVDIADTGIDSGCAPSGHLDLVGRRVYYSGPVNGSAGDLMYHGTAVAGIAGGNPVAGKNTTGGATNGFGYKDSDSYGSFYYGLGVAPGIRLGATVMTTLNGTVGTVAQWTTSAVTSYCNTPTNLCNPNALCRAVVQNHSNNQYDDTGSNAGIYTTNAREFDISVRDADRATGQALTVTVSAGNYKQRPLDPTSKVLAPATAKNVISVGGTESARDPISACTNDTTVENPVSRHSAQGYDVLGYMSRRGTNDSRLKPDLVAPATLAMAPRSAAMAAPSNSCAAAGDPAAYLWPQYQGTSGTSFAAPVAAGAVALLRYYYNQQYGFQPSPAMYKAMLVADARSIAGALDRQTGTTLVGWPNTKQGFGVITLDDLMNTSVVKTWQDQGSPLLQGQIYERQVTVADPSKPVRIVLTWTDAPALAGASTTLVNNLDLRSYGPDKYGFYGNYTDANGYSRLVALGSPTDTVNNVEVLNISPSRFINTANRTFTVRISAPTLNGVGVPGQSGGANNQDFALFVLNGTLQ